MNFKNPMYGLNFDYEWEQVQEPVTFLEAINQQKPIKPISANSSTHNKYFKPLYWLECMSLSVEEVNGMWLVENE